MKRLTVGWLLGMMAFAACAGDDGAGPVEAGAFGATCTTVSDASTECDSGVCSDAFDQLGLVCSQKCTDSSTCPEGSEGKKCNMKGYCKP